MAHLTVRAAPAAPAAPAALSRRGFVALGIGAFAVLSLPVALWRRRRLTRRAMPIMGTIADIVVITGSEALGQTAIDAALTELRRVERLMTRFTATSDIGRLNGSAAGAPVRVSADTAAVVAEALRWAAASDGAFDPAIGAAVELWDVAHRTEPPPDAAVARLAGRRLYRAIGVGRYRGAPVLVRHDADARIDLGGIACGYAVDRAADALRSFGIVEAVIDVGGDLQVLGRGPDGDGWRVGIQSPWSPDEMASVVHVTDAAITTSGTYAQYFTYRGRRYHHLLDPRLAAPRETPLQSITVQADNCLHADAAATACFGMAADEAARTLRRAAPGATVVSTL